MICLSSPVSGLLCLSVLELSVCCRHFATVRRRDKLAAEHHPVQLNSFDWNELNPRRPSSLSLPSAPVYSPYIYRSSKEMLSGGRSQLLQSISTPAQLQTFFGELSDSDREMILSLQRESEDAEQLERERSQADPNYRPTYVGPYGAKKQLVQDRRQNVFHRRPHHEIAFIGRSNVGKSSLLNCVIGQNMAIVSSTPGRTQQLHFYTLPSPPGPTASDVARLQRQPPSFLSAGNSVGGFPPRNTIYSIVDMPGYGYGKAPLKLVLGWNRLFGMFLRTGNTVGSLKRVYLLVDGRRGLLQSDIDMITFLSEWSIKFELVITKIDKLNHRELVHLLPQLQHQISSIPMTFACSMLPYIHLVSAHKSVGLNDLRHSIANALLETHIPTTQQHFDSSPSSSPDFTVDVDYHDQQQHQPHHKHSTDRQDSSAPSQRKPPVVRSVVEVDASDIGQSKFSTGQERRYRARGSPSTKYDPTINSFRSSSSINADDDEPPGDVSGDVSYSGEFNSAPRSIDGSHEELPPPISSRRPASRFVSSRKNAIRVRR